MRCFAAANIQQTMIHTYPTNLDRWYQDQDSEQLLDQLPIYAQFEVSPDRTIIAELEIYTETLTRKIYFHSWEVSRHGELYLKFTTRRNGPAYKRPVSKVKFIGYE